MAKFSDFLTIVILSIGIAILGLHIYVMVDRMFFEDTTRTTVRLDWGAEDEVCWEFEDGKVILWVGDPDTCEERP